MTTTPKNHKPASTVITVPDPDGMPVSSHAETGGTLQWRADTQNYPKFEVQFLGANPSNKKSDQILKGSNVRPVVVHLKKSGDYQYKIRHIKNDGTAKNSGPFLFSVHPCTGCPILH